MHSSLINLAKRDKIASVMMALTRSHSYDNRFWKFNRIFHDAYAMLLTRKKRKDYSQINDEIAFISFWRNFRISLFMFSLLLTTIQDITSQEE